MGRYGLKNVGADRRKCLDCVQSEAFEYGWGTFIPLSNIIALTDVIINVLSEGKILQFYYLRTASETYDL